MSTRLISFPCKAIHFPINPPAAQAVIIQVTGFDRETTRQQVTANENGFFFLLVHFFSCPDLHCLEWEFKICCSSILGTL